MVQSGGGWRGERSFGFDRGIEVWYWEGVALEEGARSVQGLGILRYYVL
jgi:hypothetical protein